MQKHASARVPLRLGNQASNQFQYRSFLCRTSTYVLSGNAAEGIPDTCRMKMPPTRYPAATPFSSPFSIDFD